MDAPRPNTSTPANKQVIEYLWKLQCGCTIKHACHIELSTAVDDARAVKIAQHSHQVLSLWFRDRQPRHQCTLVSIDNPNGISPRIKTKNEAAA